MKVLQYQTDKLISDCLNEPKVCGAAVGRVKREKHRRSAPRVITAFVKAVNSGYVSENTTDEEKYDQTVKFLPSWLLWFVGKESIMLLIQWAFARIFGENTEI